MNKKIYFPACSHKFCIIKNFFYGVSKRLFYVIIGSFGVFFRAAHLSGCEGKFKNLINFLDKNRSSGHSPEHKSKKYDALARMKFI
jgi:hypothetical protein